MNETKKSALFIGIGVAICMIIIMFAYTLVVQVEVHKMTETYKTTEARANWAWKQVNIAIENAQKAAAQSAQTNPYNLPDEKNGN